MSASTRNLHLLFLCWALLPAVACAQNTPLPLPAQAYPGDHVFVPLLGGGACNAAGLDPTRPPQVRLLSRVAGELYDRYRYRVEYWLADSSEPICGTPPPPGYLYSDVGALPLGYHSFEVSGHYAGAPHAAYGTATTLVGAHSGLPDDVSGVWYDPAQTGRGLSVTRVDLDTLSLLWFTHDAQGRPDWVASSAAVLGPLPLATGLGFNTRGTPLASGPATLATQPWGSLSFRYIGCGRAQLAWLPINPGVPAGSQSLIKLAQDVAAPRCSLAGAPLAVWLPPPAESSN